MDYTPPDNDAQNLDNIKAKSIAFYRNPRLVWIFAVCILFAGGIFAFKLIQNGGGAHIDLASVDKRILQAASVVVADNAADIKADDKSSNDLAINDPKPLVATVRKNDNLKNIFRRNGLDDKSAASILALKQANVLRNLKSGKKINIALDATRTKVEGLVYEIDSLNTLVITARDEGWDSKINHIEPTTTVRYTSANIDKSIYTSGKKAGIPGKLMAQFVNIFSHRMNINKLRNGDSFALFYKEHTVNGKSVRDNEIVAAELVHKGKVDRVIAFTDPHGITDFYTPNGRSIKPAFIRYPVSFKRVGSRFSMTRLHPILGTVRPHLGVDLSASTGTPIKATSNGKIAFVGTKGGYGRAIILKNGVYSTLYAHLSRFASNIQSGKYVKQGQVIGYVGSTGLSTSAHLHYEFRIKGIHYDPLNVKLPAGEMIASKYRGQFFALSKKMLAQLDLRRKDDKVFAMYSNSKFE
ncbi:MAG: peptidoglycan DD-metalloendopeptidase family protein [Gammaproteobacteria bacterium]|nr:peptidoglycan DD-metalloendopeptidase family protein [Gammaproteobacteria bacterium]